MDKLEVNGHSYLYSHLTIEIAPLDLLSWLQQQTLFPKVCWFEKGNFVQRAAIGNLLQFSSIPSIGVDSHPETRFYGGKQFGSGAVDENWDSFPSCAFWLPQFEIVQEKERTTLHIHSLNEEANPGLMRQLCFAPHISYWNPFQLEERHDIPSFPQWKKMVAASLEKIHHQELEKIVIARKTRLYSDQALDPYALLAQLYNPEHRTTLFSFQFQPQAAFLGSSPELLYHRKGSQLQTDAVAGTRARGSTEEEDLSLQSDLINNDKEQREFALVKQFIDKALEPLCTHLKWNLSDTIVQTPHVQHIYNHLKATLKPGISDHDLIVTLHPTPALGGKPRHAALEFLSQIEPFQRGWYGSPVGYLSAQEADIAVAIRSALLRDKQIDLFAGTGIVQGSYPEQEWGELDQKIKTFACLGV